MTAQPYRFLALRWQRRYVIVPVASILRIEARDDRVCIVAERPYPHEATFTAVCAQLERDGIVRVHRSHAINLAAVREVAPRPHGEFALALTDGSVIVSGRSYRCEVEHALGIAGDTRAA
jgi:DNA-binding LytR/AlgR family response regulator